MQRHAFQKNIMSSVICLKVFVCMNYLLCKTIMIHKSNSTRAILMAMQTSNSIHLASSWQGQQKQHH